jgi:hypothetical protein
MDLNHRPPGLKTSIFVPRNKSFGLPDRTWETGRRRRGSAPNCGCCPPAPASVSPRPRIAVATLGLDELPSPLDEMPAPDSELEDALFTLAGHVFLQTSDASACLDTMERVHFAVFTASCLARAGSPASRGAGKIFVKICRKRVPHAAFPSEDYCKWHSLG